MMLLLHGLPISTKYQDIKLLLKRETSLNNFILDNLMGDSDGTKKVTIGVSDEHEGSHLMKCLNGYRMPPGNIIRISPMSSSQPVNIPPQTGYDQRSYPPRNNYQATSEPVYNRSMPNDSANRVDPWGPSSGQRSQWTPNQSASSLGMQQSYGYQEAGNAMSSGQPSHNAPLQQRPYQQAQQDERYGFQAKNNMPDTQLQMQKQKHTRSHFLRSVEIVDEPLGRSMGHPSDSYPDRHPLQKPITIMKDNFQGPQYSSDRPTQPSTQYSGHNQPSWGQQMQTQKINPTSYDRKYHEPEKRPLLSADPINSYKGQGGPRFSPRKDIKDMGGPRFSPRRDIKGGTGSRFSPRRDIKDISGPRFSPRRDVKDISGPRFSPRRDIKDVSGPTGPRFSPRRDVKQVTGPRFSPRRDVPRFSPRRDKDGPRFSPRRDKDDPRFSPRRDKDGPRFSPRRDLPKDGPGARYSPTREMHMSHHGRRPSPGPGRRMSPTGRRISPGPMERRRRESPPGHRRASPGRDVRYSPTRHLDKGEKYPDRSFKDVRPAYEPPAQASNQAMYPGAYRPNIHENVQYPIPGLRQPEQRPLTWQENKPAYAAAMKKNDDRDGGRMPKFEPRIEPRDVRKSRSPLRRERSPVRDRFKKHSPSPRSPRRSWALEKRRSPEIREPPPPPMWPGQNQDRPDEYKGRNFEPRGEEKPRMPVWERPAFDDKMDRQRRPDDRAFVDEPRINVRTDLTARRPAIPEQPRAHFSDREATGHDFRRMDDDRKLFDDRHTRRLDRREVSPRREDRIISVQDKLQKEIDDVYKRAVEFHKRVEERKGSERHRDEFEDRSRETERHAAKEFGYREEDRRRDNVRRYDEPHIRDEPRSTHEEPRSIREKPGFVREEVRNLREEILVREKPGFTREEILRRSRAEQPKPSGWKTDQEKQAMLPAEAKVKREKAVEEISQRILGKYGANYSHDIKRRVQEELKTTLRKLIRDMFGDQDVSFIEMVIKFNAKYDVNDEKKIFDQAMSGFPSHYRSMKRGVEETAQHVEVPPKTAKISTDSHLNRARVLRPSRPPSRKYEQHGKMAPPAYKTVYRTRDPSFVRKRPYPLQKPTAPFRKIMPSQELRKAPIAKPVTLKTVAQTSKGTVNTPRSVEKSKEDNVKTTEDLKMDFDDDLDVKGLREEPTSEGHYELNPLMSRVLEKELQTIMIKVWQDLPDKPPTAAEKAVVNKLRTEAGDALKNVLGLNVSKRLLNIHNPLYVKVSLSRKPDRVSLKEFVQTYNCIGLKYVPSQSQQRYTFVAQFRYFADFDRICTSRNVRCGNETVSIIPYYKFTTCPPHLKSIYTSNSTQNTESEIDKDSNENQTTVGATDNKGIVVKTEVDNTGAQKVAENKDNASPATIKNTSSIQIKKSSDAKKETVIDKETKTDGNAKPVTKVESQATKNNENLAKKAEITPTKAAEKGQPAKVAPTAQQVAKPQPQTTATAKAQVENTTPAKTQARNAIPAKPQPEKTTPAKTQPLKVTPVKAQPQATTAAKKEPQTTTSAKTPAANASPANTQPKKTPLAKVPEKAQPQKPTPTKVVQKPTPQKATNNKDAPKVTAKPNLANKKLIKSPQKGNTMTTSEEEDMTAKISEMIAIDEVCDDEQPQQNDEDILDDKAILALMSGAIVLDECRGSDEE